MERDETVGRRFERLVEILGILRSEQGCPWDRQQDERSIANYFLEEVFEAVDAVAAADAAALREELGDVMMEVVFLAQIYAEKRSFTISDVLDGIVDKMTRRHPHVFGGRRISSCREVVASWQENKAAEKKGRPIFQGMPKSAPALLQAFQIGQKVAAYGFDWGNAPAVLEKVKEEVEELGTALQGSMDQKVQEEIGDLLFAVASLSRLAGQNPELALRAANQKFKERFLSLEKELLKKGKKLGGASLEEMEETWERIKRRRL